MTRADVRTGDLLMCVPAVHMVFGVAGSAPDASEVAQVISAAYGQVAPHERRWLELLGASNPTMTCAANAGRGNAENTSVGPQPLNVQQQQEEELQRLLSGTWHSVHEEPCTAESATHATAAAAAQNGHAPVTIQQLLPSEGLATALEPHLVGEAVEDVAVSELRQVDEPSSYCGLWPEASLLTHSCAPNTVSTRG
jgi:hypothetical protein